MTATEHEALNESAGLYVLGALAPQERAPFEAHLASCADCTAQVRMLSAVAQTLMYAVPQVDPPAQLRNRILSEIGGATRSAAPVLEAASPRPATRPSFSTAGWLAMAAMLALAVAAGAYALSLRQRIGDLETALQQAMSRLDRSDQQLAVATGLVEGAQLRMAVLTASDLKQVTLAGQPAAPQATGRAFWSRSRGLVFAAADLPPLPTGRTYQLWYVQPGSAPPVSAGLLKPDQAGRVAAAFDTPAAVSVPAGLAVSIEPEGGVPAPTGAIYLAGNTE